MTAEEIAAELEKTEAALEALRASMNADWERDGGISKSRAADYIRELEDLKGHRWHLQGELRKLRSR